MAEQVGEPELARHWVFQRRFLRLQFTLVQRQLRWSANPVTSNVTIDRNERLSAMGSRPQLDRSGEVMERDHRSIDGEL